MKRIRLVALLTYAAMVAVTATALAASVPEGIKTVPLATITTDRDTSVSMIQLMVNAQSVVRGIYIQTWPSPDSGASSPRGRIYWLNGIQSDNGVVLGRGQGVEAIFLEGRIKSGIGRGSLVIRYLSNGIFSSFDKCRVNLKRIAPYRWQLVNAYNQQLIEHIKVETWALGISTLINVCPESSG